MMIKAGKSEEIKLKVVEALQDDAYKGVARIDPNLMKAMDLKTQSSFQIVL